FRFRTARCQARTAHLPPPWAPAMPAQTPRTGTLQSSFGYEHFSQLTPRFFYWFSLLRAAHAIFDTAPCPVLRVSHGCCNSPCRGSEQLSSRVAHPAVKKVRPQK